MDVDPVGVTRISRGVFEFHNIREKEPVSEMKDLQRSLPGPSFNFICCHSLLHFDGVLTWNN